jgi:hypothetical protein
MLFGSGAGVMKQLESFLLLGWHWKYALKPPLATQGVRMENVLFVPDVPWARMHSGFAALFRRCRPCFCLGARY